MVFVGFFVVACGSKSINYYNYLLKLLCVGLLNEVDWVSASELTGVKFVPMSPS